VKKYLNYRCRFKNRTLPPSLKIHTGILQKKNSILYGTLHYKSELRAKIKKRKKLNWLVSLKGWSHEIGKACRWFHGIDLKFKGFRFKFIFSLNVVFTTHVLKVAPIRVRFSPGFPPGARFHGEQSHKNWPKNWPRGEKPILRGSSVALEVRRSAPLRNANPLEQPPWKRRRFFAAPAWR
jgi:hypothetical protein